MKKKATDSEIRAFIEAICPEAPDLYAASFDEATCLRDATNLIRQLRAHEQAIRAEELAKIRALIAYHRDMYSRSRIPFQDDAYCALDRLVDELDPIYVSPALPAARVKEGK